MFGVIKYNYCQRFINDIAKWENLVPDYLVNRESKKTKWSKSQHKDFQSSWYEKHIPKLYEA